MRSQLRPTKDKSSPCTARFVAPQPYSVPYWSQILSKSIQLGAADEILARSREEGDARESMNGRAT